MKIFLPSFPSLDAFNSGPKVTVIIARDKHYSESVGAGTPKANSSSFFGGGAGQKPAIAFVLS